MTVGDAVKHSAFLLADVGVDNPQLDAQLIMARVLRCSRLDVIAHSDRLLSYEEASEFGSLVKRRVAREPLAYLTEKKEFYGLDLEIKPGVLVPRPETEILVEECISRIVRPDVSIVDVGSGSGAIAVALAMNLPQAMIYAIDLSDIALEVTQANSKRHDVLNRVRIKRGDLLEPLVGSEGEFDVIVSNPPYIPSGDIDALEPEVSVYEPREALDGGPDGLDVYRLLVPRAKDYLRVGGFLAVEMGLGQAGALTQLARDAGYSSVKIIPDLAGIERIGIAYK